MPGKERDGMGCVQRRPVRVVLGIVMSLAVAYPALGAGEGPAAGAAAPPPREMNGLNLLHFEDFEKDPGVIAKQWRPTDPKAWAVVEDGAGHAYALKGASDYTPPVRSPHNISLLNDLEVTDFVFQADMKQTGKEYGHRDMCIFFGYQDPAHFYYVHIATRPIPTPIRCLSSTAPRGFRSPPNAPKAPAGGWMSTIRYVSRGTPHRARSRSSSTTWIRPS